MHTAAGIFGERLRHKRCVKIPRVRNLFDNGTERHHIIGGLQGISVAQVDLVLSGTSFMVAELHRDTNLFKHGHRLATEILHNPAGRVIKIGFIVYRYRKTVITQLGRFEQIKLNFRRCIAREPHFSRFVEGSLEYAASVGCARLTIGCKNIAEHAGGMVFNPAPRQYLECGGIGLKQHIGFVHARKTLNRGTVKAEPFLEGAFNLSWG